MTRLRALAEAGHKVVYAAVDMRSIRRKRQWGFESLEKSGVSIEAVNVPCGRIPRGALDSLSLLALKALYKRIEKKYGRPDIIHAHFIEAGYSAARLFEGSGIPLVFTEHYSAMNKENISPYFMMLGNFTYPRMDKVLTVGSHLAENIKAKFGVEAEVVPNIVDTASFEYRDAEKKTGSFDFVSTGSLLPVKRMNILIEAFGKAFKGDPDIRLYIFGDGPERSSLETLISGLGLAGSVLLMGLAGREAIAARMSESGCFVLASSSETFGVAYIEALAMGLPVIATKCGGPEDFVNDSNGVLVAVDDIDALGLAMRAMHENIGKYDRRRISEMAKGKFGPQAVAAELIEIYKEVLNNADDN